MLLSLATLGLLAQRSFARLSAANNWNLHTYKVLGKIDEVGQVLNAHEAQLRGFALTGDARLLAELENSTHQGARALREVAELTGDNLGQQQQLAVIAPKFASYNQRFIAPFLPSTAPEIAPGVAQRQRIAAQTRGALA